MLLRTRYNIIAAIGYILAKVPLSRVTRRVDNREIFYCKKRLWLAPLFILVGNLYLKFMQAQVRVLSKSKWLRRAQKAYKELLGIDVQVNKSGELLLPELQGTTLDSLLSSPGYGRAAKMRAIETAIQALREAHGVYIGNTSSTRFLFSHGDATVENVFCEPGTENVYWFDFETIHYEGMPAARRHADDLRALIYSAAKYLEYDMLSSLCRMVVESYEDPDVLQQLNELIIFWRCHPIAYHLAQCRLEFQKKDCLDNLLIDELGKVL